MPQLRPDAAKINKQINKINSKKFLKNFTIGNSLAVQWLGLGAFTAEGLGSIPVWGTKIP